MSVGVEYTLLFRGCSQLLCLREDQMLQDMDSKQITYVHKEEGIEKAWNGSLRQSTRT
jgi:hypothetical protein